MSDFGTTQPGVRWKIVMCATCGAIAGTNWIALAPVPITATRRPSSMSSPGQCAEWNTRPLNSPRPGISGIAGRVSCPQAVISTSASTVSPLAISSRHRPAVWSHAALMTSESNRTCRSRSKRRATSCR